MLQYTEEAQTTLSTFCFWLNFSKGYDLVIGEALTVPEWVQSKNLSSLATNCGEQRKFYISQKCLAVNENCLLEVSVEVGSKTKS